MYDVPLLTTGLEHLYATLNPSPDLHSPHGGSARSSTNIS
jgi:hypothetical protein